MSMKRMWLGMRIKENILHQKSRLEWDCEGDLNKRVFHCKMKERRRRNFRGSLVSSHGLLESVDEVKKEVKRHFSDKFEEPDAYRLLLEHIHFNSLSIEHSCFLEATFME